jgi:hypothetical protein
MIFDSAPWKAQLARDADELEVAAKRRSSGRRGVLIERTVFLGAYAIRKLDDATKLSSGVLDEPLEVKFHATRRAGFSSARLMDLGDFFEVDKPVKRQLPRRRLLNIIIHSIVFLPLLGARERCQGFFVTSDHSVKDGLYMVELAEFTKLMRIAAEDFPSVMTLTATEDGSLLVWTGHPQPVPDKP